MPAMPPQELIHAAQRTALNAAVSRLRVLGWDNETILSAFDDMPCDSSITGRIDTAFRESLPVAMEEFSEAIAARMPTVAVQTFTASAALSGIRAANAYHQATRGAVDQEATAAAPRA